MGARPPTFLRQPSAKVTSNGKPGSAEAARFDRIPHRLTQESGAPKPQ